MKGIIGLMSLSLILAGAEALEVNTPEASRRFEQFSGRVPGLTPEMLYADFWVANTPDASEVLMTADELKKYNFQTVQTTSTLVDLAEFPEAIPASEVRRAVEELSCVPESPRFYHDGRKLDAADYRKYLDNLALDRLAEGEVLPVRYALAVSRELLRTFPTADKVTNSYKDREVDMFVETVLYPGEAVAVLHESRDGEWFLVQKYNYLAWAKKSQLAFGDRDEVLDYANSKKYLVVTGAKVRTVHNPENLNLSELEFDMGCRIPLVTEGEVREVDRMGSDFCFVVKVPERDAAGNLKLSNALIQRSADVNVGYLPYTRENIIRQAFKFLGERYGWGDDNNGRDCSGFVVNIFSSMGLVVPRNGGEQEREAHGVLIDTQGKNRAEREAILRGLKVGDVISSPTHIMVFLGGYGDELWMIHDHMGSNYIVDGEEVDVDSRCVGISPILGYMTGKDRRYYENFTGIKRLILPEKESER